MLGQSVASVPQPSHWQRLLAYFFGPPLPMALRLELTRQLGGYFVPFLIAGVVAAMLAVSAAVLVRSTLAMFFAGLGLAGFGFIVLACFEARSSDDDAELEETEARYGLGTTIVATGVGGIVVAVLAASAPLAAQALVVMVALAVLGGRGWTIQGRPELALLQSILIAVPTAAALAIRWPVPWGVACALGVVAFAAVTVAIARRAYLTQADLLRTRDGQRAERNRMRAALEHLGQAMAVLDSDMRLVMINRSALDMLGIEAINQNVPPKFDELLSSAPNLMKASGNREEFLAHADLLVTARQPFSGVLRLNDDRMVDLECLPIPDGGWVTMMRDSTGERHAIAELNREIRRCALTGLPNRRGFLEELERRLGRGDLFALLIIDLDGFKQVNDRHGHSVGDRMITRIGFRLRTADPSLYAARLGGDEFAILAEIETADGAVALARQLIETIDVPARFGEAEVQVGAAIGVAMAPDDGVLAETLLRAADLGLLAAKANPGNQIRLYTPDLLERSARTANLEARVRSALRGGRIDVAYQPMVDLRSGKVVAVEALARWRDDGGEPVAPDQLVAIAEARGLVSELRRMVLEQALAAVTALPMPLDLWVNTSVHDLRQPGMVSEVMAALAAAGLPPSRLTLEVTETALMTDDDGGHATLSALCSMGIGVAMDDFGAGFSSLDRLRRLPITALKISGSLLQGVAEDRLASDIFGMAANLGKAMQLLLVAEGVQGLAELALTRAAGIHRAQGFVLAAPVPAEQLAAAIGVAETAARMRPAGAKHAITNKGKAASGTTAKSAEPVPKARRASRAASPPAVEMPAHKPGKGAKAKTAAKAAPAAASAATAAPAKPRGAVKDTAPPEAAAAGPEIGRNRRKPARA